MSVSAANSQGATPLHLAAVNGHLEVCRALLGAGADLGALNKEGKKAGDVGKTEEIRQALRCS